VVTLTEHENGLSFAPYAHRATAAREPRSLVTPMATNEAIVLKTNFDAWKQQADDLGTIQPWLYYCLEQFLKPYALDVEETEYGITDGGNDGGADGIYFLVNHRLLVTDDSDIDPKSVSTIRLIFFQVKQSGGISPIEIEKWLQLSDDFFDLSKNPNSFGSRYNDDIKLMMRLWRDQFLKMSVHFPELAVDFYYVTGDDASPDDYALDACARVETKVEGYTKATCKVHCIGARQLWEQVQKRPPRNRTLRWAGTPMGADEGYVGLVKLKTFRDFLEDAPSVLAERIFESNVRGFAQDSAVNEAIGKTLAEPKNQPNFWLLNNGVTIIAAKAVPASHLLLGIEDPQIVNGLQTSRVIFDYFTKPENKSIDDDRTVLVRVIQTADQAIQDKIIKATNSQNKMAPASLRMTDQVHRDIEELFKKADLFYDRRKGFYRDQGRPVRKIVSVNAVAQAIIAILLQRPDDARGRPGDYFKDDDKYELIFANSKIPLTAYLTCTQIVRRVEWFLEEREVVPGFVEKNLKFYTAALAMQELTGLEFPVASKLPDATKIDDKVIGSCFRRVAKIYIGLIQETETDGDSVARGTTLLKKIHAQSKRRRNAKTQKHAA